MTKQSVVIIGAGVSGLTCAIELEKKGYAPIIIDQLEEVGGRLQTEEVDGFVLDRGFQVLLSAYPAVKEYLDLEQLDLNYFKPGAAIFKDSKFSVLGDPLRDISFLKPIFNYPYGTLVDKFKIWRLSSQLKKESLESIFSKPSMTTMNYLKEKGFSNGIIDSFFKPFYAGIFLEEHLDTSSRMFEFVFKMFAEGYASLPNKGIQQVALQLKSKLKHTEFVLGKKVVSVKEAAVELQDGKLINFDKLVLASYLEEGNEAPKQKWNGCWNLYFETDEIRLHPALIGLNATGKGYINNFSFIQSVDGKSGISVTVVKAFEGSPEELSALIEEELWTIYGINAKGLIKSYAIPNALPHQSNCLYSQAVDSMQLAANTIACGDSHANSSLNAAMLSGAKAASLI